MQILASGKTAANKYDLRANDPTKTLPRLDVRQIATSNQFALEVTQGFSYSGEEGSSSALDDDLSIIDVTNLETYKDDLAKVIQTLVANNSFLDVDGGSTANSIILQPRKIADIDSPDGNNYAKLAPLPFAFRDNLKFVFRATTTNTAATQFSIPGLTGLSGSIGAVDESGSALVGGEIIAGKFYEIITTGTATTKKVVLKNRSKAASQSQVNSGTNTTDFVTPETLSNKAFIGFRAYRNGTQTISSGVRTKVQLNAENFDTKNWFDSSTNYRFTPQKAGFYQINCSVTTIKTAKSPVLLDAVIYKNGAEVSYHNFQVGSGSGASGGTATAGGADLVYMNGSTDYLELYTLAVYSDGTSPDIAGAGVQHTYFCADFRGA